MENRAAAAMGEIRAVTSGGEARRLAWLIAALLAVAAIWNTCRVLTFDFVAMDDDINLYFNPNLGPPGRQSVSWMFTDVAYMRRYVPLGWLAFSCVYPFSGLSPVGYHAATVGFHAANTLLVYLLLILVLARFAPGVDVSRRVGAAAVGAAMWSFHPFRAESIGWASGLFYGTAGFWALLSTIAYVCMLSPQNSQRRRLTWLLTAALLYAASILSYPVTIALPLVFLVIDFAVNGRDNGRVSAVRMLLDKSGFALAGVLTLGVTVLGRFNASIFWPRAPSWDDFTLGQRVAQSFAIWAHYLWKTWWPTRLTPAPTWLFEVRLEDTGFVASAVAVIGLTTALSLRRRWSGSLMLWLAYLALLIPLLGLTEHPHFACDRYAYLAGVVLSVAIAFALVRLPDHWFRVATVLGAGVVVAFGWLQRVQLGIWRDTDSVMTCVLGRADDVDFKCDYYHKWALFHANRGRPDRADEILAQAEHFAPTHPRVATLRRDLAAANSGGPDRGAQRMGLAAAQLHTKLAMDFSRVGRRQETQEHFRLARELSPGSATLAFNWAVFCALNDEPAHALQLYYRSISAASLEEVSPAARAKLLGLMAESFAEAKQPRLAASAARAANAFRN